MEDIVGSVLTVRRSVVVVVVAANRWNRDGDWG